MPSRLERAHANTRRRISREAQRMIRRAWVASSSEGAFADEAIAISRSARSAVVGEVDAFLATYLTMGGVPSDVRGLDPERYVRPVDPQEQWRRPHKHLRMKLAEEMPLSQALAFGRHQAESMIATDLQHAQRSAATDVVGDLERELGSEEVWGSRRVASGVDPCGLCIAASDQLYWVNELQPLHVNCECSVVPIVRQRRGWRGRSGGGQVTGLSNMEYERVLAQTGNDTSREALSRVRLSQAPPLGAEPFQVVNHGELGPYMFPAGHSPPLLDVAG